MPATHPRDPLRHLNQRSRRYPLWLKLGLALGLVAALSTAGPAAWQAAVQQEEIRAQANRDNTQLARLLGDQVEHRLVLAQRELAMLAARPRPDRRRRRPATSSI